MSIRQIKTIATKPNILTPDDQQLKKQENVRTLM